MMSPILAIAIRNVQIDFSNIFADLFSSEADEDLWLYNQSIFAKSSSSWYSFINCLVCLTFIFFLETTFANCDCSFLSFTEHISSARLTLIAEFAIESMTSDGKSNSFIRLVI